MQKDLIYLKLIKDNIELECYGVLLEETEHKVHIAFNFLNSFPVDSIYIEKKDIIVSKIVD